MSIATNGELTRTTREMLERCVEQTRVQIGYAESSERRNSLQVSLIELNRLIDPNARVSFAIPVKDFTEYVEGEG